MLVLQHPLRDAYCAEAAPEDFEENMATKSTNDPRMRSAGQKDPSAAADRPVRYFTKRQIERGWRTPPPQFFDSVPRYGGHSGMQIGEPSGRGIEAQRLSHLVLGVSDLDYSEGYYRDFLGMDLRGRGLTAESAPHSLLQMNTGQYLVLVQEDEVSPQPAGKNGYHHAFSMTPSQYRALLDRCREKGLQLGVYRAQFLIDGEYTMNLIDPDGHHLEINCFTEEAFEPTVPDLGVVDCGPADQYKVGAVKLFKEAEFYLVRTKEGFLANSRWCSHLNGRVVYEPAHWRFHCPYHGAEFDRQGNCVAGQPYLSALRLHPISFSDVGNVLVDTGTIIERPCFSPEQAAEPPGRTGQSRKVGPGSESASDKQLAART